MKKNTIVALHPQAHPHLKIIMASEPGIISASLGDQLLITHGIDELENKCRVPAIVCSFSYMNQQHAGAELVIALPDQGKPKNHRRAFDYGGPVADYFFPQQVTVVFFQGPSPVAFYQSLGNQRPGRQLRLHQWVSCSESVIQDFPVIDTHYCSMLSTPPSVLGPAKEGEESRQVWCDLAPSLREQTSHWLKKQGAKSGSTPSQGWDLPTLLWATPLLFVTTYCLLWGKLSQAEASSGYPFSG